MSDPIAKFKDAIRLAKQGDAESVVRLRNVLRVFANEADRGDVIEAAEFLSDLRDKYAREDVERN
jgi:hypothetical protein